ncbi:hypothetical protein G7Y89_g14969 [Cudoniella acicularis]|uniref:ABM domain-containing protein n=1 Tax=Cudoniella acicularis TaxID=354080 RepID=A0A8H4QV99_9HELO|nr:hypothetical protein G7Y89_g14969 [Cudoniella acicularis]
MASSQEVHICAIITPAKGKESRVKELLADLAGKVEKHEKDVSKYQVFEQYDSQTGVNVFVVEETYKDKSTFDAHLKTEYFGALGQTVKKEGLLAKGLKIMSVRPVAGYPVKGFTGGSPKIRPSRNA